MDISASDAKRRDRPALWDIVLYIPAIMISLMTMADQAQASGTITNPLKYCAQYTGHLCNVYTTPQYFIYSTANEACQSVYPGNPVYHDYGGGYCTPSGNVIYVSGWLNQPNAVCSGSVCTCNTGYQPDAAGTSCVPVNSCPPNMSGSPCVCNPGYSPHPYYSMGCFATPACPAHSYGTYPNCTCDSGYVPSGSACVPEPYTLELDVPAGSIEPIGTATGNAKSSKTITARVTGQQSGQPKFDVAVRLTVDADVTSGGHDHGENVARRPRGSLRGDAGCNPPEPSALCAIVNTDPNGYASFVFTAPEVSGTHAVAASCDGCTNAALPPSLVVKVPDLATIPASPYYVLEEIVNGVKQNVGATPQHNDNHYATAVAIGNLIKLALKYKTAINRGQLLYVNDASLKWGGLLDDDGDWLPPHSTHRLGDAIDIRADSNMKKPGEIPKALFPEVMKQKTSMINPQIHCYTPDGTLVIATSANPKACNGYGKGRHFHVIFK